MMARGGWLLPAAPPPTGLRSGVAAPIASGRWVRVAPSYIGRVALGRLSPVGPMCLWAESGAAARAMCGPSAPPAPWCTGTAPPARSNLYAAWGSAANDIWAVGAGLVVHWDGDAWSTALDRQKKTNEALSSESGSHGLNCTGLPLVHPPPVWSYYRPSARQSRSARWRLPVIAASAGNFL
jgi:hypothetical protein